MTHPVTREYNADEIPRVGDVVQVFNGAFGAGIISEISDGYTGSIAVIERIHAHVSGHDRHGQIQIGVERLTHFPLEKVKLMPVYITGHSGSIDNRLRA